MPLRFQAPTTPLPYSSAYSLDDFVAQCAHTSAQVVAESPALLV